MTHRRKLTPWPLAGLLALGIGLGAAVWLKYFETYHFAEVHPGVLYRDGVRSMREFSTALRKGQIRTIVMLNDDDEIREEPFQSEVNLCQERGVKLVRIPVTVGQRPETEQVQQFLDAMSDPANHPVLVHCAQGVRRTAMMVAAYQETILKYDNERTKQAILPWGRKPERLVDIRGFIDDYDPATRTVGSEHRVSVPQDED